MDILETDAVLSSLEQNVKTAKKPRIGFKAWLKKFFVRKNIISLVVIFITLLALTQMSMSFGYRMGMMDTVKKQSQLNF